jgi:serine protease Do
MNASGPALADMVAVVKAVRPSVVAIDVNIRGFGFFNQPVTEKGSASGWVIDSAGIIVTNNHVVENATSILVTLSDGRVFPGVQVATDPFTDLAVVKINATGLPAAKVGDSGRLEVGQQVAAIGNALGEGISMTGGYISRLGALITDDNGQTLYDLIETDTAINPGNSGGPLVNTSGEVIGITNAKLVAIGVELIGFAISTKTALPIIQDLVNKGNIIYPYIGVSLRTVDQAVASQYNLAVNKGALITSVTPGSPAAQAGLQAGDVVVNMSGTDIGSADDAVRIIRSSQIGQKLTLRYYRGNNVQTVDVTLAQRPS